MSSIIIDKLKQIENTSRDEQQDYSVIASSSAESSCSDKKKGTDRRKSSDRHTGDQTSTSLRTDDSDYYEAYHVAKVWAGKLRKLAPCQKLYAEKAIHDILFEAQLGNLHKSSVKINGQVNLTKRTPSATSNSHSHSSYSSKSTNSTALSVSMFDDPSHSEPVEASSEVLISEAYLNENGLISSESHPDNVTSRQNLPKVSPTLQKVAEKTSEKTTEERSDKAAKKPPEKAEKAAEKTSENTHNQTYIVAATPNSLRKAPLNTQTRDGRAVATENREVVDESAFANAGTNTPDCILKQLSRYIRDCYDNYKNYLPPTQQ